MEEKLNPLAETIISRLVFEESFVSILSEIRNESEFSIGDELKTLIVKDYVKPCRDLENDSSSGVLFDSDRLRDYSFTLTGKGISYLSELPQK